MELIRQGRVGESISGGNGRLKGPRKDRNGARLRN